MKQEIKERIDQINQGVVPIGYKQTPVGICPCNWKEITLSKVFDFKNGLNKEKEAFGAGTPIVNYMDVYKKRGLFCKLLTGKVKLNKSELLNYSVQKGDVFFTRTSETIEEIGFSAVMLDDCENTVFSGFVLRARPKNNLLLNEFNKFCFSTSAMRNEITKKSSFTTRALTNGSLLGQVNLNIPAIIEQQKIAEVLTTWDNAVDLQEKKIEKLQEKKKALMQKLLAPKPDWEEAKLGEICEISTGKLDANKMVEDGSYPFFTCSKDIYRIDKFAYDCEALLMAGNGEIGDIKYYNGKFNAYQRTYVLTNFKLDIKYVMQYLLLNFDRTVCKGMQKSSMPYIKLGLLQDAIILYPKNIEKISKALDLFDDKIQIERQLLEKYKEQRKALMQLLLTGIVRV